MGKIHGIPSQWEPGQFSSDTERNPKEQVNAILLRRGKQLEEKRPEVVKKEKGAEEVPVQDEVITEKPRVTKIIDSKETQNVPFPNQLKK